MRYYILFFLLIVLALAACKKDNSSNSPTGRNHIVAHDSIPQNNLPQVLAGVYTGTQICYSLMYQSSTPIDTNNNLRWIVVIISDSSITLNGNLAYIDLHIPAIYFYGPNESFGVGFDTISHSIQVQTPEGGNVLCIFNGNK